MEIRVMNRYFVFIALFLFSSSSFAMDVAYPVRLQKQEVYLGGKKVVVELADTEQKRTIGLSGREKLEEGQGMLFIFEVPQKVSFHMRGVRLAISIGFFNENRVLEQIEHMVPEKKHAKKIPLRQYNSRSKVKYALEVPDRWFSRNKIFLGTKLEGI